MHRVAASMQDERPRCPLTSVAQVFRRTQRDRECRTALGRVENANVAASGGRENNERGGGHGWRIGVRAVRAAALVDWGDPGPVE